MFALSSSRPTISPSTPVASLSSLKMNTTTVAPDSNSSWAPVLPDPGKCNYFIVNGRTEIIKFGNPYGGIPQNLLINIVGWTILVLLFALIRRAAGNYGRLALIRRDDDESKWTEIFYSQQDDEGGGGESRDRETEDKDTDSVTTADFSEVDSRFLSWVSAIFTLRDDMIVRRCGTDALQYMKFQRHLIIFMLIITTVCCSIILPINMTMGNMQGDTKSFGRTTISNIPGEHGIILVHIIIGILFMPLGIFIMRKFSVTLDIEEDSENLTSRTLMLDGIPKAYCKKDYVIRHFHEAYPAYEIEDVQVAYNVGDLCSLSKSLATARKAIVYCESYSRKHGGKELVMSNCGLVSGFCCPCCCNTDQDASTFYKEKETELKASLDHERKSLESKANGVAFVTFASLADAKHVNKLHRKVLGFPTSSLPPSSLQLVLMPRSWNVRMAPPPEDIYWENLNHNKYVRVLKVWVINIILFLVLFFFTTPSYIISLLETIPFLHTKDIANDLKLNLPSYVTDFLPTLFLWTLSALLPVMVAYSDFWLGHWRRSVENLWIMRKVFGYLLFMVLVLPSIGLTTLSAFLEKIIKSKDPANGAINWQCIFLPDNGAFFINYVTTSALVGTGLELLRFPELFMYGFRLCFARSQAEISSVRKAITYEFSFGVNYGWMLLIFALTVSYSVICPLITPFGLFYLIMKHGVDRYNIYFAYKRSKINKNIHGCAINCVMISLLLQQLILLFFNTVRNTNKGLLPPKAILSITMFTIFCLLFLVQMFFNIFKGMSPIQYRPRSRHTILEGDTEGSPRPTNNTSRSNGRQREYLPDVLKLNESSDVNF